MENFKIMIIPIFIFTYGFLFLHLGMVIMMLRNKPRIYTISSYLMIIFSLKCITGSFTIYNNFSYIILNLLEFIFLTAMIPIGLDFLSEIFNVRSKWINYIRIILALTLLIIVSAAVLLFNHALVNVVSALGFAWMIIVFCFFLVVEGRALFPLRTMPKALRIFTILYIGDIFIWIGMFIIQLSGKVSLMFPLEAALIISLELTTIVIIKYPDSFKAIEDVITIRRYEKSTLSRVNENKIVNNLESLMTNEELYLNPELRLADLSEKLDITQHQLSELINTRYSMTFNNYVNKYRIEYACNLLETRDELTVLQVAFKSGFNSKSAFNSAFKILTGKTPTVFYKQRKQML